MLTTAHNRNNFDFLRMFLAVLVIYSHSRALGNDSESHELFNVLTRHQNSAGALGVDGFFILSGYLISESWKRSSSLGSYLKKRILRIYPAFIVCCTLCVFLVFPLVSSVGSAAIRPAFAMTWLLNTLNLTGTEPPGALASNANHAINGSLWSIRFEFGCYLGLAILGLAGIVKRHWWMAGILAASILIRLDFLFTGWNHGLSYIGFAFGWPLLWSRMLPLFLAGMTYGAWAPWIRFHWRGYLLAIAVMALGAVTPNGMAFAEPTAGAYLLFAIGQSSTLRLHNFGRYGDFSYGTYLYAFPIQQLIVHYHGGTMNPWLLFTLATPCSIAAGMASWFLVERHFLKPRTRGQPQTVTAPAAKSELTAPIP